MESDEVEYMTRTRMKRRAFQQKCVNVKHKIESFDEQNEKYQYVSMEPKKSYRRRATEDERRITRHQCGRTTTATSRT
eukprot:5763622-Amphidinium_carterae.1